MRPCPLSKQLLASHQFFSPQSISAFFLPPADPSNYAFVFSAPPPPFFFFLLLTFPFEADFIYGASSCRLQL